MSGMDTVWISSEYPVENGKIHVEAVEDSSIVSGGYAERENIYFEYPPVAIDSANFYSDNSTGTVDRVVIHYAEKLDSLPDSISVYWPSTYEGYQRKIYPGVENDDGDAVLSDDSMSITVNLDNPFTEGKTDALDPESLSGPGADSWVSPFEDIGFPPLQSTGPGLDRTGPILLSATVVERFEPGADSLTVRLSESIDLSSLSEGSMVFTLIKRETGDTVRLDMAEADSLGTTQYRFLIPDKGDSSPVEYDSLKLDHLGDVKDLSGTSPDPKNPLVRIEVKKSKMPIEHAYYADNNADGMVDSLIIEFNTEVNLLSFIEVSPDWKGYTGSLSPGDGVLPLSRVESSTGAEKCLLAMIDFQTVYDSATMARELVHVFTKERTGVSTRDSIDIRDYNLFGVTTGSMEVTTVQNIERDTAYVSAIAHDSAAPVLMSAVYRWGELVEDGVWAADTLVAEFSEEITESELKEYPLKFMHPAADSSEEVGEYNIGLEYHSSSGTSVTFVVDSGSNPPWDMDSVWINPAGGVVDLQNNTQDNKENIKTNIRIEGLKPHTLTCMVKNPFEAGDKIPEEILDGAGIGDFEGTFIEIRPGEGVKSRDVSLRITGVQILDLVGNAVIDAQAESSRSSVNTDHIKSFQITEGELDGRAYILWDAKNSNGRDVGAGGYIVYVEAMRGDERYVPGADRSGPLMFQIKRP